MTPGLLYVGVATLTGSVLGRNRIAPIRILLPPTALIASLAYFLPKTFSNVQDYASSLEGTYFPGFAGARQNFQRQISSSLGTASRNYTHAKEGVEDNMKWARRELENKTGLKVGESNTRADLGEKVNPVSQQDTLAKIQDEAKKLGEKAGKAVDEVVTGLKEKADRVRGDRVVDQQEEPPERLV